MLHPWNATFPPDGKMALHPSKIRRLQLERIDTKGNASATALPLLFLLLPIPPAPIRKHRKIKNQAVRGIPDKQPRRKAKRKSISSLIWTAEGERRVEKTATAPRSLGSSGRSLFSGEERSRYFVTFSSLRRRVW